MGQTSRAGIIQCSSGKTFIGSNGPIDSFDSGMEQPHHHAHRFLQSRALAEATVDSTTGGKPSQTRLRTVSSHPALLQKDRPAVGQNGSESARRNRRPTVLTLSLPGEPKKLSMGFLGCWLGGPTMNWVSAQEMEVLTWRTMVTWCTTPTNAICGRFLRIECQRISAHTSCISAHSISRLCCDLRLLCTVFEYKNVTVSDEASILGTPKLTTPGPRVSLSGRPLFHPLLLTHVTQAVW